MQDHLAKYERILVSEVYPNPHNPRQFFSGPEFARLVASVQKNEVIQPILVRKVAGGLKLAKGVPYLDDGTPLKYELVAGERRWRATCEAHKKNGGLERATIPAIVRVLDDEAAFDLMFIENFHRKDLQPLEEAKAFKAWLDRKGTSGSITELSKRTNIDPQYIRRRIAVLALPEGILKAWAKGKIKYGHLEQIMRVKTKAERLSLVKVLFSQMSWQGVRSVKALRNHIDNHAPALADAKFDIKKAGCPECPYNSHVQELELGAEYKLGSKKKPQCLSPACFKKHQNNYLTKNWKKTGYRKRHKTNGFRFADDIPYADRHYYSGSRIFKECKECDKLVTIINLDGSVSDTRTCIGPQGCLRKLQDKASKSPRQKGKNPPPPGTPRVPWHGEFFREEFYKQALPEKIQSHDVPIKCEHSDPGELKMTHLVLYSILKSNQAARVGFAKNQGIIKEDGHWWHVEDSDLFTHITKLDANQVAQAMRSASIEVVMEGQFGSDSRRTVADYLDIDLKTEWQVTAEYLGKKTIKEITEFCEKYKIFKTQEAQTFVFEVLGKKRKQFGACKKGELIRLVLECGVDLKGKVPDEILDGN